ASDAQPNTEISPLLLNRQGSTTTGTMSKAPEQPPKVDTDVSKTNKTSDAPTAAGIVKAATDYSWTTPVGLPARENDDENLLIFRRAVGINSDRASTFTDSETLEKGRKQAVGVYRSVIQNQRQKRLTHHILGFILYASHFLQIVLAATLTALGPNAKHYEIEITVLGAVNTVTAGVLAVLKGSGMIERLAKDEVEFKKLQDWIEETESLLSVGIIGRNRKDIGILVEVAFKKYNACFGQSYEIMASSEITGNRGRRGEDADASER
ncbi:hypothetical protein N0V82_007946, partial [Gnomoniopsis sp. IMI 355080]